MVQYFWVRMSGGVLFGRIGSNTDPNDNIVQTICEEYNTRKKVLVRRKYDFQG